MTAEIAVLNKEAVALAADSTATAYIQSDSIIGDYNPKMFKVDKVFSLGTKHAVGIMTYGSGMFMGIPWGTIIKVYKERLPDKSKKYLKDYAEDFLCFLEEAKMIPQKQQEDTFKEIIRRFYNFILEDLLTEFEDRIETEDKPIDIDSIKAITNKYVDNIYDLMKKSPNLPQLGPKDDFEQCLEDTYPHVYEKLITDVFEKFAQEILTESQKVKLYSCATYLFTKDTGELYLEYDSPNAVDRMDSEVESSGIIIAGFGDLEVFPSIRSYRVIGQFASRINYVLEEQEDIGFDNRSQILSFAQNDIIERFVTGIDDKFQLEVLPKFRAAFDSSFGKGFPKDSRRYQLSKIISELPNNLRDKLKGLLSDWLFYIINQRGNILKSEILEIVELLPKQELALLAENLLSVTALARRVSSSEETVGWPIDVAVISKGEGFVWIKKKNHYENE